MVVLQGSNVLISFFRVSKGSSVATYLHLFLNFALRRAARRSWSTSGPSGAVLAA